MLVLRLEVLRVKAGLLVLELADNLLFDGCLLLFCGGQALLCVGLHKMGLVLALTEGLRI